jgi:hypothetical protein
MKKTASFHEPALIETEHRHRLERGANKRAEPLVFESMLDETFDEPASGHGKMNRALITLTKQNRSSCRLDL